MNIKETIKEQKNEFMILNLCKSTTFYNREIPEGGGPASLRFETWWIMGLSLYPSPHFNTRHFVYSRVQTCVMHLIHTSHIARLFALFNRKRWTAGSLLKLFFLLWKLSLISKFILRRLKITLFLLVTAEKVTQSCIVYRWQFEICIQKVDSQ